MEEYKKLKCAMCGYEMASKAKRPQCTKCGSFKLNSISVFSENARQPQPKAKEINGDVNTMASKKEDEYEKKKSLQEEDDEEQDNEDDEDEDLFF